MSKRQLIPAALREEFTEYSSLIRALRTTHTLDLPVHLTEPYSKNDNEEGGQSHSPTPVPTTSPRTEGIEAGRSKRKRSESEPNSASWKNRDQWTRWPIPVKDVPPPDWSLQDEIGAIIKSVLASSQPPSLSSDDGNDEYYEDEVMDDLDDLEESGPTNIKLEQPASDIDEDEQEVYYHHLAEMVTPVIENKLESLFALISAHTISRPDSMQNRIEPFDWHDLINILGSPAAGHLVDEMMLRDVSTRMEQIFETTPAAKSTSVPAPSSSTAIHRHVLTKASSSRLNGLLSKHTASLFEQNLPPQGHKYLTSYQITARKKKAQKRRSQKKDTDEVEELVQDGEETDEEDSEEDVPLQNLQKGKGKQKQNLKNKMNKKGKRKQTADKEGKGKTPVQHDEQDWEEGSEWEPEGNST
ncbi:hypothetical protein NP233_g5980 [Leucocoprinus birnbaumii]|uniref:Rrn9 domain-containing protein n=1 Tax=Leucocoprinus birnbaumii TaxID=56174 RepID=A0AAD5YU21_9AGAR|nr:hypothetical protein NP233_g5980 [Leucocoprinus birnbaumii]